MALRAAIAASDAVLICTPSTPARCPGALKNLLEWTIAAARSTAIRSPWVNVSGPAAPTGGADAHDSLRKVLTYAHVELVEAACRRVPFERRAIGADGLVADPRSATSSPSVLTTLAAAAAAA